MDFFFGPFGGRDRGDRVGELAGRGGVVGRGGRSFFVWRPEGAEGKVADGVGICMNDCAFYDAGDLRLAVSGCACGCVSHAAVKSQTGEPRGQFSRH